MTCLVSPSKNSQASNYTDTIVLEPESLKIIYNQSTYSGKAKLQYYSKILPKMQRTPV